MKSHHAGEIVLKIFVTSLITGGSCDRVLHQPMQLQSSEEVLLHELGHANLLGQSHLFHHPPLIDPPLTDQ